MSNFSFLTGTDFYDSSTKSEHFLFTDSRSACFYARHSLELAIKWLYNIDKSLKYPYTDNLMALIHEPTFKQNLAPNLFPKLLTIIKLGNKAVHDSKPISQQEAIFAVKELWHFFCWLYFTYTPPDKQVKIGPFDEAILKNQQPALPQKSTEELKKLQEELQRQAEESKQKDYANKSLQEELDRVRDELAKIKAQNEKKTDPHDYNENETREFFIDLLLREVGWDPDAKDCREFEVKGMPYESETGFCDYVLWGDDGLPLAVVEAKKTKVSPEKGRKQASLYADCLDKKYKQRPIIFYTNGYTHYIWDDKNYPPREVQGFYTKEQLQTLINRRDSKISLNKLKVNQEIAGRYYQIDAIKAVCQHFEQKERKALIVMATGAGKTRTTIALVDVLLRHNWVKRVLFLADRNALVEQACGAFRHHLPNSTAIDLTKEKEDLNSRIMVSTYPTMMNLIDETKRGQKRFGPGYFDIVIIDEAHRSVYKKYGAIFDYFDSLLIGLTATPRDESDRDTYRLFELQPGVPTYFYELDQAVLDKYLVPAKAAAIAMKLPSRGIKYSDLSKEEKEQYEDLFYDDETDSIPPIIEGAALNNWLFNTETVDNVLKTLMEQGLRIDNGDKLGKTIIFARNHKHAEFILERFDKNYPKYAGHFASVVDNYIKHASSIRRDFSKADKMPQIAISVDMLDTGVDIPEVLNLVFFKPVYSRVKFLQMLGRGTRTCKNIFGPDKDKEYFQVFDFCNNFIFFDENPEGIENNAGESLSEKIFKRRIDIATILKLQIQSDCKEVAIYDEPHQQLRGELLDRLCMEVSTMNIDNFIVRSKRQFVEKYKERSAWDNIGDIAVMEIKEKLASLPNEMPPEDLSAKQFDLLMFNCQLSLLTYDKQFDTYQKRIKKLMRCLSDKVNIPMVKNEIELINNLQTDEYWQNITVPILDNARKRLRDLLQFIENEFKGEIYSDFEDVILGVQEIVNPLGIALDLPEYKEKVKQYIKEQEQTIVIQKLKNNIPVTTQEISQLETMLFSNSLIESREKFEKAFGRQEHLGVFIRKLTGLDRNAAKEAFSDFIQKNTLNTSQIRFVDLIINYLTQNGTMEIGILYEPPFTNINDSGIDGVFTDSHSNEVIAILKKIDRNAGIAA